MTSLADWLVSRPRDPDATRAFDVVDLLESKARTGEIEEWMAGTLFQERFSPQLVQDLVDALGWDDAAQAVRAAMPAGNNLRKGYFGEVLAEAHLEHFDGYSVPVRKLRYMMAAGQSLPGVDVFAIKVGIENAVVTACYLEAKVRTGSEPGIAVTSVEQLSDGVSKRVPEVLLFVAARLEERSDPLYAPLLVYMHDRAGTQSLDEYRSFLTWERQRWSERVIENLAESDRRLTPLTVVVAHINELDSMIERCYQTAGLAVDPDDD